MHRAIETLLVIGMCCFAGCDSDLTHRFLDSCRVCGGALSTRAQSCPHCGDPKEVIAKRHYDGEGQQAFVLFRDTNADGIPDSTAGTNMANIGNVTVVEDTDELGQGTGTFTATENVTDYDHTPGASNPEFVGIHDDNDEFLYSTHEDAAVMPQEDGGKGAPVSAHFAENMGHVISEDLTIDGNVLASTGDTAQFGTVMNEALDGITDPAKRSEIIQEIVKKFYGKDGIAGTNLSDAQVIQMSNTIMKNQANLTQYERDHGGSGVIGEMAVQEWFRDFLEQQAEAANEHEQKLEQLSRLTGLTLDQLKQNPDSETIATMANIGNVTVVEDTDELGQGTGTFTSVDSRPDIDTDDTQYGPILDVDGNETGDASHIDMPTQPEFDSSGNLEVPATYGENMGYDLSEDLTVDGNVVASSGTRAQFGKVMNKALHGVSDPAERSKIIQQLVKKFYGKDGLAGTNLSDAQVIQMSNTIMKRQANLTEYEQQMGGEGVAGEYAVQEWFRDFLAYRAKAVYGKSRISK
jgi:hypothetical protein